MSKSDGNADAALLLAGEALLSAYHKIRHLAHEWHSWPDPTKWPGDQGLPVALEAFEIINTALDEPVLKRAMERANRKKRQTMVNQQRLPDVTTPRRL